MIPGIMPGTYGGNHNLTEYIFKYDKDKHNLLVTANKTFATVNIGFQTYTPTPQTTAKLIESANLPLHQMALNYNMRKEYEKNKKYVKKLELQNNNLIKQIEILQVDKVKDDEIIFLKIELDRIKKEYDALDRYYKEREQSMAKLLDIDMKKI
jgi:hypothetical protein